YLINTTNFVSNGPIFFYTGNEGDIELFAKNTGLMWDSAPEFNAAIVFAEHRFYGKSQPFSKESYSTVRNLGYLSSEQALADFALLIRYLRNEANFKLSRLVEAQNSSVIAFGGSYGGMLAAWMRIKYPHLVEGAIASSAPVFWFIDMSDSVPEDAYNHIVKRSFVNSGCIEKNILNGWKALENLSLTAIGRAYLNRLFRLDKKSYLNSSNDWIMLKQYLEDIFESMAMVNYPYPSNYLAELPGWPVKVACQFFNRSKDSDEEYAQSMFGIMNLYYNYTGQKQTFCINPEVCEDSAYSALGDLLGWSWQSCTEMVMQQCSSGPPNDFFIKNCPFTVEGQELFCSKFFGKLGYTKALMRPHWSILNYGHRYPTATNIVFSNGYLDPWSAGGWSLKSQLVGPLISIIIKDGAHHYDLRGKHQLDTKSVKEARRLEKLYIKHWRMVSFFKDYSVLLLLLLQVLVVRVISNSDIVRKLGLFPTVMSSISRIHNTSGSRWMTTKTVAKIKLADYNWDVKWYRSMPIDHFSYRNVETFSLKYLANYSHFHCDGPLFFYAGNEGDIEIFAQNTGIMWDLAPQFHAALVFAEHRYYGESKPYGKRSYMDVSRLGYLNDIQALADFAELISFLKTNENELGFCSAGTEIPVIVFGGSYGGMLAAWFRMKYPHIVDGAWASSAPIRNFYGTDINRARVSNVTATIYVNGGCDRKVFSEGFLAIEKLSKTEEGRMKLNQIFHSKPGYEMESSDDFTSLYSYMYSAIFYMAMTDYPYPVDFLTPLPSYPVKYVCQFATKAETNDEGLAEQLFNIINVYYNYTGQLSYHCFTNNCTTLSPFQNSNEDTAWHWQCCTSLTVQNCDQGGENDFFLNTCNDSIIKYCNELFEDIGYNSDFYKSQDVMIRYGMIYNATSNIIFSNGNLDPWSGGGVYENSPGVTDAMKRGVYVFYMSDAAHHLDLRTPNTCDPPSVSYERFQVVNILKCWVYKNCTELPLSIPLPNNTGWQVPDDCKFIKYGYPWGYTESKVYFHPNIHQSIANN
uniref:Lysosomal Pro-X carboxypeptidase n=1 Tax=Elaeophora elaphi TaxID=1147741 RepID=A0A0R3RWI0_9BILA